jgi:hypothetical protein
MSTRSCIARPSDDHLFEGVYVHFDGYPSGVGAAVHSAARFFGTPELAAQFLIDDHPAGWSSIASADLALPFRGSRAAPGDDAICRTCKQSYWRHFSQYYERHGLPNPGPQPDGSSLCLHHSFDPYPDPLANAACPYPETEKPDSPLRGDGDDWGTEYAYVIGGTLSVFDRVWNDDTKMIGMFGSGAATGEGRWRLVTQVAWDADYDGPAIETDIRLFHELNTVARTAGLGDKTGKDP